MAEQRVAGGKLRIAVLLSGSGTSLENLFEHIDAGLPAEVVCVVSSKKSAFGLERAEKRGIPAIAVARREHPDVGSFNDALHEVLARFEPDLVCLLGFLSPFELRGRYEGRALNVHPALIPAFSGQGFYGHRVHEAVLEKGVKLTGATVHFASGAPTRPRSDPVDRDRASPDRERTDLDRARRTRAALDSHPRSIPLTQYP